MTVTPLNAPGTEPWLTKAQLADRLQVSSRWIDYRREEGMPFSEVERWLNEESEAA